MNTNVNITKYKSKESFRSRLYHNNRKSTLDKKDLKNIIFKKCAKDDIQKTTIAPSETRSQISKKIARLRYKSLHAKKQSTIDNNSRKIEILEEQLSKTIRLNTRKNHFIDISFSITHGEKFTKDLNFIRLLEKEVGIFIKNKFKGLEVLNIVSHSDQSSPHIHISGQYLEGSSISQDLERVFGDAQSYSKLQQSFNKHIKSSKLVKKYNLNIDTITPYNNDENQPRKKSDPLPIYKEKTKIKEVFDRDFDKVVKASKNILGVIEEAPLKVALWGWHNKISKYKLNPLEFKKVKNELKEANETIESQANEINAKDKIIAKDSEIVTKLAQVGKEQQKTINDQNTSLNELSRDNNELSEFKKFAEEVNPNIMSKFEEYKRDQRNSYNRHR